jgi:hypothetical protein
MVALSNAFQPLSLPKDGVPERFHRLTTPQQVCHRPETTSCKFRLD